MYIDVFVVRCLKLAITCKFFLRVTRTRLCILHNSQLRYMIYLAARLRTLYIGYSNIIYCCSKLKLFFNSPSSLGIHTYLCRLSISKPQKPPIQTVLNFVSKAIFSNNTYIQL
ncbi:GQ67_00032T0 [Komagataella phaffii]|nr:GQ67_00032T0 [Komagataella phaffii]AOA67950.1 GQ68_01355T0 [Komagataella phaffii GS115]